MVRTALFYLQSYMSRGFSAALLAVLVAISLAQISLSVLHAVQGPSPPPLYAPPTHPAAGVAPAPSAPGEAAGVPAPTVTPVPIATPDPADIIWLTFTEEGPSALRMKAPAHLRLFIDVKNDTSTARTFSIADARGTVIASQDAVAPGQHHRFEVDLPRGSFSLKASGARAVELSSE